MALETQLGKPSPHIPGKKQNCNEYGTWLHPEESLESVLCHGGKLGSDYWMPCEVRYACKELTERKAGRRHLTILDPRGNPQVASKVVAEAGPQMLYAEPWGPHNAPTNQGQLAAARAATTTSGSPRPEFSMGAMSPVFVPKHHESVWTRLAQNVGNGFIASLGFHLWQMAMQVDIFGSFFRKKG